MPDGSHNARRPPPPGYAYRVLEDRVQELEKLADQFWPGSDQESRTFRALNVWKQLSVELDWELIDSIEPLREPLPSTPEGIMDICTSDLQPYMGETASGYGDLLRAELHRQGTDLESFIETMKPAREDIPWEAMYPIPRKNHAEKLQIKYLIRSRQRWNHP